MDIIFRFKKIAPFFLHKKKVYSYFNMFRAMPPVKWRAFYFRMNYHDSVLNENITHLEKLTIKI